VTGSRAAIISFASGFKGSGYAGEVADMANRALGLLDCPPLVSSRDIMFDMGYVGDGYEVPSQASTRAIRLVARREGIFLDPVYTAKAFAGLLDYIERGKIAKDSTVVFWHTGGATALFAEKTIVGRVCEPDE
jgi:L-cysteate sulfo-lyase